MPNFSALRLLLAAGSLISVVAPAAARSVFGVGSYVVALVGDGSAAFTSPTTAVFLLEYSPGGTLTQTVALPRAADGSNLAFTETDTSAFYGFVTCSAATR